jgi:hypothetical protein
MADLERGLAMKRWGFLIFAVLFSAVWWAVFYAQARAAWMALFG